MMHVLVNRRPPAATGLLVAPLVLAATCLTSCRSAPNATTVDPERSAAKAIELYDANRDGALDESELAACPPLAAALSAYDANADGKLTEQEIAERLTRLFAGPALVELSCNVTLDGRALPDAEMKFRPAEMLTGAVHSAQAVTDVHGHARPTIGKELLPEDYQTSSLLNPGLYTVEITHREKDIPAPYNEASTLGFEVDPAARGGLEARFDLKSR
jgi:hypothetical protein